MNGRGKPVIPVTATKLPVILLSLGVSKVISETFPYLSFLNVPFFLELSLVKMSKFSH